MKQDIKKEWVAALRSGRYPQGSGGLLIDGKYCCLGVLAEVMGEINAEDDWGYDDVLTPEMAKKAGLQVTDPYLTYDGLPTSCSCLNDNKELTFPQIADLVEAQL